jgi:hypothetical protein
VITNALNIAMELANLSFVSVIMWGYAAANVLFARRPSCRTNS